MVRFNLICPALLTDEHLKAEYVEMLMFAESSKKFKGLIPATFRLGKGHQLFFKNKGLYVKNRFELIKKEMFKRGFQTNCNIDLSHLEQNDFKPSKEDIALIVERINLRYAKKPEYYHFNGLKALAVGYKLNLSEALA